MPGPDGATDRPTLAQLRLAKREAQRRFEGHDGVEGVGIGDGCVRIYVRTAPVGRELPAAIEGVRLERVEVGVITAQPPDR